MQPYLICILIYINCHYFVILVQLSWKSSEGGEGTDYLPFHMSIYYIYKNFTATNVHGRWTALPQLYHSMNPYLPLSASRQGHRSLGARLHLFLQIPSRAVGITVLMFLGKFPLFAYLCPESWGESQNRAECQDHKC